jgi:hypothetical protein
MFLSINLKTIGCIYKMEAILSTNDINNFSVSELNYIRETIENMNKFNQIEVLRILNRHKNVFLNENKYGIHINLSELDKEIINELNVYIKYVNTQEQTLNSIEKQKEDYRNTYFSKDIKDNGKLLNSK